MEKYMRSRSAGFVAVKTAAVILSCLLTAALLAILALGTGSTERTSSANAQAGLMDKFDMYMTNRISEALDGVLSVEKVYWLSDEDLVAPEPDQSCYGEATDPKELQWLLDAAAELLDGQQTVFTTETEILEGSKITYYLDETIFAITWKTPADFGVYTYSEIKIADASQFRRFLAGGEYGSEKQFVTTEMAASVNAVVASSGDFYRFRNYGTIVHEGIVRRVNNWNIDSCLIDDKGDLHLIRAGQLMTVEEAQQYVDDNHIRFSVAFGPILVADGKMEYNGDEYLLGECDDYFPRAALCQKGELHYVLAVVNIEDNYKFMPTINRFAAQIEKLGCDKAYALDGGQTAAIVMNDQLINNVHYGYQREISDIIYFATAVPDGG